MKKIFVWILVLIAFSSFVYADCSVMNNEFLVGYFSFDSDCATEDKFGLSITNNGVDNVLGHLGNACDFEDTESDYIRINNYVGSWINNNVTIGCFFKEENNQNDECPIGLGDNSAGNVEYMRVGSATANQMCGQVYSQSGSLNNVKCSGNINTGQWYQGVAVINSDGKVQDFYFDGSNLGSSTANTISFGATYDGYIGATPWGGARTSYFDGLIDECFIYNQTLTQSQIDLLYNSGVGCNPLAPAISASLSLSTNLTTGNYTTDIDFSFSGTPTNTGDFFNCSVYWNTTINQSFSNVNITELQIGVLDYSNLERGFDINVTCSNNNATDSFLVNDVFLDSILPNLLISSNFLNNSNYYDNTNLIYNITISDNNLFAINHTIINLGDNSIKRWDFKEDMTETLYILNVTNSTEKIGVGNYEIFIQAWDSHTNNKVKPIFSQIEGNNLIVDNKIIFELDDIKFYNKKGSLVTYFYLSEDRYKMKITWNTEGYFHTLRLRTNNNLYFIPDSNYKGHFVYFPERWIDFEGKNIKDLDITQLSDNYYEIVIEHNTITDEVELESIGDLNYNSQSYFFNITAAPDLNSLYLLSINDTLTETNKKLENMFGGIEMLPLMLAMIVFFILALATPIRAFLVLSGGFSLFISFLFGKLLNTAVITNQFYYKSGSIFFMIFGLLLGFWGAGWQIIDILKSKKKTKNSFYDNLNY